MTNGDQKIQQEQPLGQRERTSLVCSFCGKAHYEVQRLIVGPSGVGPSRCICNECVARANDILRSPSMESISDKHSVAGSDRLVLVVEAGLGCSICGKQRTQWQRLLRGLDGCSICNDCIELCNEIITEHTSDM